MPNYDAVVIGLGATGSAALHQLARRGLRVLGIERFAPGHAFGSSHGATRLIRLGYFEHHSYVPLLRRAYALWRELEAASGQSLLQITGIAELGPPDSAVVAGTLHASRLHRLPHEVLNAEAAMRRFPAFRLPREWIAVLQPDGGYLTVEAAIAAQIECARGAGAHVRTGERVLTVTAGRHGVRIETETGTIKADRVAVCAGPWLASLVPALAGTVRVTRQAMAWFSPSDPAPFAPGRCPVFLMQSGHGIHYGFPLDGDGRVKIAKHHHADETTAPDGVRGFGPDDEALIRNAVAEHLPAANGALADARTCLYTVAPDDDFILDRLPDSPDVIVASPCSGHGFKFAPAIGEIVADLVTSGKTGHDISRFALSRFG